MLMFPPLFKVSEMSFKASLVPAAVIITDAADGPGFFFAWVLQGGGGGGGGGGGID